MNHHQHSHSHDHAPHNHRASSHAAHTHVHGLPVAEATSFSLFRASMPQLMMIAASVSAALWFVLYWAMR